jgi:hypothetical protein
MITAYARGHRVKYDGGTKKWVYVDTGEDASRERPCIHCGRMPTSEGYDACIFFIVFYMN